MLDTLLSSLRSRVSNDGVKTAPADMDESKRRKTPRRVVDRCVSVMYGQTFPVENWSFGGILIAGDDRLFGVKQDVELTLKFKLNNAILEVPVRGHVVRKTPGKIAIEFEPLTTMIKRNFQNVVDDYVASEFAKSQI